MKTDANINADANDDKFSYLKKVATGEIQAPLMSSDAKFWTHEPFNPLIGKIIGFNSFEHPQYGRQETVIVERENGEVVSAILTNYLQTGMVLQNGDVGDLVLIEKQGQERSKYGKTFNKFLFVVQKQEGEGHE